MPVFKNFVFSLIATAPSPADTGTTFTVTTGEGSLFPDPDTEGSYNLIVFPSNANPSEANAEIVTVTDITGDVLTITREQEGTSARTIIIGDRVILAPTAAVFDNFVNKTGAEDIDGAKNILASFWNFAQNFSFFGKTRTTDGAGYQFQLAAGDAKGESEAGGGMQLTAGNADSSATEGTGGSFSTIAGSSRGTPDGGDNTQLGGSSQDGRGGHSINRGGQSNGAGLAGEGRIEGADGASGDQDGGHAGAIGGAPSGAGLWGRFYIKTQALYKAYFNNDGFTADRNFTLPDNDGTLALLAQIPDTSLFFDRIYTVLSSSLTAGSIPNTDYIYEIPDVSYVLTLENANSVGDNLYYIKNTSAGNVTIDTSSSNTFDGVAAPFILSIGESIVIHANGTTDWKILARYGSISKGVVIHGSDDTVERPSGYISIEWIGSVEPTNAIDNDTWINTA